MWSAALQSKQLISKVEELSIVGKTQRQIPEVIMREQLVNLIGEPGEYCDRSAETNDESSDDDTVSNEPNKAVRRKRKPLDDRTINNRRCIWLNKNSLVHQQKEMREETVRELQLRKPL